MYNPFRKRASENIHDSEAYLPLVSHAPIDFILSEQDSEDLYKKLTFVLGTPGSGKTTFGRLFEFRNLSALHRTQDDPSYRDLAKVFFTINAINEDGPCILAARLPMDAEYRGIWELPYPEPIKKGLFLRLLQSRCVITWLNSLKEQGFADDQIEVIPTPSSPGAIDAIGGNSVAELRSKAIEVEIAVYNIVHALVPRSQDYISDALVEAYDPLKNLDSFILKHLDESSLTVKLMLIVDDAHELHKEQFASLTEHLINRDLKVIRWVLTRFDIAISINKWIQEQSTNQDNPGRQHLRDYLVLLTNPSDKYAQRRSFRSAAHDIANRYLQMMPIFMRMGQTKLSSLLEETYNGLSRSNLEKLSARIDSEAQGLKISKERIVKLRQLVDEYADKAGEPEDIRLAMLRILLHRYSKRTPQQELFADVVVDAEPKREMIADIGVVHGARLFLFHEYQRPYYYGADTLADAGSGNIEQFLKTANELVTTIETRLIRSKHKHTLSSEDQHKLIRGIASDSINKWDFPLRDKVKAIVDFIGKQALDASLQPNAYLDHGANAYGIPQVDFDQLDSKYPELAQVLHYATAYNALSIHPEYRCKNEVWAILELGGYPIIKYGLPFNKGGFVEGGINSLHQAMGTYR